MQKLFGHQITGKIFRVVTSQGKLVMIIFYQKLHKEESSYSFKNYFLSFPTKAKFLLLFLGQRHSLNITH